ncbi:MAG: DegT/DnrJ/EryC1/StrS family aminotransferase [Planctomycetaceae bacterium]|nr:DegT/DnrJ/EryC1/StrS family aminotransferase [Planctomycetaceae bacterium]
MKPHLFAAKPSAESDSSARPRVAVGEKTVPKTIASRLPPVRGNYTWFSSGRAAFAYLLSEIVPVRTVYLPTYVCWSLVDVMLNRFPETQLKFYSVDRSLNCRYPIDADADTAVLSIHYFGHRAEMYRGKEGVLLEDCSHVPLGMITPDKHPPEEASVRRMSFGSLRKAYRVADGGFVEGFFNPVFEADRHLSSWLRLQATDWKDLREAENMTDRHWKISDISGHSLAAILQTDVESVHRQRRQNEQFLAQHLTVGNPMVQFRADECPLLHNRLIESTSARDSLRSYLATQQIFTSVHWPVHEHLIRNRDHFDCEDAAWIDRHVLSFPVSEDYDFDNMERICNAVAKWHRSGASRFVGNTLSGM